MKYFKFSQASYPTLRSNLKAIVNQEVPVHDNVQNAPASIDKHLPHPYSFSCTYEKQSDLYVQIQHWLAQNGNNAEAIEKHSNSSAKICFLYTGQGCQRLEMDKPLRRMSANTGKALDLMYAYLTQKHGIALKSALMPDLTTEVANDLQQTLFSQPGICSFQVVAGFLLEDLGLKPDFCIGHSIGEFAAAVQCKHTLPLQCLDLVAKRAQAMHNLHRQGTMLACRGSKEAIDHALQPLEIAFDFAACNSPRQTVIALPLDNIDTVTQQLRMFQIRAVPLKVSNAFHSRWMEPACKTFRSSLNGITVTCPKGTGETKLISTVSAEILDSGYDENYLSMQIRNTVRFEESIRKAYALGCRVFIEIGPQNILNKLCQETLKEKNDIRLYTPFDHHASPNTVLRTLCQLETEFPSIQLRKKSMEEHLSSLTDTD